MVKMTKDTVSQQAKSGWMVMTLNLKLNLKVN